MRSLIREFFYERVNIAFALLLCISLYSIFIFSFNTVEVFLSYLTSYMFSSLYGYILWQRKNTNWELFLMTTPLGRKKIVDASYLLTIILNIIIITVFYLLYLIRSKFLNIDISSDTSLNIDIRLLFASFGVGLISTAILFPTYLLADKESKFKTNLLCALTLILCLCFVKLIYKLKFIGYLFQNIIFTLLSLIIFTISYFIALKKYTNKDF